MCPISRHYTHHTSRHTEVRVKVHHKTINRRNRQYSDVDSVQIEVFFTCEFNLRSRVYEGGSFFGLETS